jgi:hypothetical protein
VLENYQSPIGDQNASGRVTALGAFSGDKVGFLSVSLLANVYTLVMTRGIDRIDATVKVCCADQSPVQFHHSYVNDKTIEVRGFSAVTGDPANAAFCVEVDRKAVG